MFSPRRAFTLVELLVVLTIITLLISLLLPAMEAAVAEAHKARCASNQHAIAGGAVTYATQNSGEFFTVRGRQVIFQFDGVPNQYIPHNGYRRSEDTKVNWVAAMATVGLAGDGGVETVVTNKQTVSGFDTPIDPADTTKRYKFSKPLMSWMCPTVNLFGSNEPLAGAFGALVGYQYFGGIEKWRNPDFPAGTDSNSPVTMQTSRGSWVLTGDILFKDRRVTVNPWFQVHAAGLKNGRPPGGNFGHVDGSVAWSDFYDTNFLHAWNTVNYAILSPQKDLPFKPSELLAARKWE